MKPQHAVLLRQCFHSPGRWGKEAYSRLVVNWGKGRLAHGVAIPSAIHESHSDS